MASSAPEKQNIVPPLRRPTDFTVIDTDPHFNRVIGYMRPSDVALGATFAAAGPGAFVLMERVSPSYVGKGGFPPVLRLAVGVGLSAGFFFAYQRSINRFHGLTENSREVALDEREMVDKVKRGEPLYGTSTLDDHQQGVAARNSRFANFALQLIPWFNLVNHNQHGVDTAKYYQAAERELEAERIAKEGK